MIDLVIPLLHDRKRNHIDLKYALRSIEKNINKEFNLVIVGTNIPNWMRDAKLIKANDDNSDAYKERNIFSKVKLYCEQESGSESFIFSNDDIFFLKPISKIPFYYKNDLKESYERASGNYRISLKNTYNELVKLGKPTLNFDVHFPIEYNRNDFLCTFVNTDWNKKYGYVIKSMYCNSQNIEGERVIDMKLGGTEAFKSVSEIERLLDGRTFFSTSNHIFKDKIFIDFMDRTFPNKSRWEK